MTAASRQMVDIFTNKITAKINLSNDKYAEKYKLLIS